LTLTRIVFIDEETGEGAIIEYEESGEMIFETFGWFGEGEEKPRANVPEQ
jgi:hypothetical protein